MSKRGRVKPERDYLMSEVMRMASMEKKGRKKLRKLNVRKSGKCSNLHARLFRTDTS